MRLWQAPLRFAIRNTLRLLNPQKAVMQFRAAEHHYRHLNLQPGAPEADLYSTRTKTFSS
jgi:hypothetical protein